jgi:hypothetical protein
MGFKFYDETLRRQLVYDSEIRLWAPTDGKNLWSTSAPRAIFDDFRASVIHSNWSLGTGIDAQAVAFAAVAGTPDIIRGTTGNVGDTPANDAVAVGGPLVFQAEDGEITFFARVKFDDVTNLAFFIGLSDVLPETTLEMPATLSVVTYSTVATDAVGFLFDTAATTDTIRSVGVANNVDASHGTTGLTPTNDTYRDYRIVVATNGDAKFYVDGVLKNTITGCVTASVNLCPIVVAVPRTTAVRIVTIDAIGCD